MPHPLLFRLLFCFRKNPSTKGDKVILNIAVAYKNLSELMYSWSEMGNLVVSLNGADTPTPSFIAPHVRTDTNVTFCVTVTNELGRTSSGNITATINASNEAAKIISIAIHGMHPNSTTLPTMNLQHTFQQIWSD